MPYVVVLTIDRDLANVVVKNRCLTNDFHTFRTNTAKRSFSNIIFYMLQKHGFWIEHSIINE